MAEEEVALPKKKNKGKTVPKKNPIRMLKFKAKRHVSLKEKEEVVKRTESKSTTIEDIIKPVTQSDTTFNGTPVELKDEPIEFDDLVFPKIILEAEKKKKEKGSQRKKILKGQIKLQSVPQVVKPVEDKSDYLYIADIQEYSDLDLYLDELIEVRVIGKH